jgi:hypothetical protein
VPCRARVRPCRDGPGLCALQVREALEELRGDVRRLVALRGTLDEVAASVGNLSARVAEQVR